jgi:guanylate cyclase
MVSRTLVRLIDFGILPGDRHDARLLKRLQVIMSLASIPVVAAWGASFVVMGHPEVVGWPVFYCAGTVLLLAVAAATHRFELFSVSHLVLVVVAPFGLHWMLGGYLGSGGAFLWGLLGPVAAMMFRGPRQARYWFAGALVAAVASLACNRPPLLTPQQIDIQFMTNTVGFTAFLFLSTSYFVDRLEDEGSRSERLILNILPGSIAERLKREEGTTIADRFEGVTVLFADIHGFTVMSQRLPPRELVALLDELFTRFDAIADRFSLEKIKTIGDAYMMVGGLPKPAEDHALRVARAALAMREAVRALAKEKGSNLSMRIGIHSGEVVSGVIGRRKFAYDLWGDTVNTASRMESHGEPDRIHVSDVTNDLLGKRFKTSERGEIDVKGKGLMRTFWLEAEA